MARATEKPSPARRRVRHPTVGATKTKQSWMELRGFGYFRLRREYSPAGTPIAVPGRKIRPAVKRFSVRCQPYRHGPPTSAGQCLNSRHINGIDICPLLAVYLYGNIIFIDILCNLLVFKRFLFHDVAPVAG